MKRVNYLMFLLTATVLVVVSACKKNPVTLAGDKPIKIEGQ